MEKLSAELFTYENYEPNFWDSLDLSYKDSMEIDIMIRKIKYSDRESRVNAC